MIGRWIEAVIGFCIYFALFAAVIPIAAAAYWALARKPPRPIPLAKWAAIAAVVVQGAASLGGAFMRYSRSQSSYHPLAINHDVDESLDRELAALAREWNVAAAPLVKALADPNVSADKWLEESEPSLRTMHSVYLRMVGAVELSGSSNLKLIRLVDSYRAKLEAVMRLRAAYSAGDDVEVRAAMADLEAAIKAATDLR